MWRRVLAGGVFAVLLALVVAACAVSRWTARNDVHALIAGLAAGGSFPRG